MSFVIEVKVEWEGGSCEVTLWFSVEAHQAARRRSKDSVVFQVTGMMSVLQ